MSDVEAALQRIRDEGPGPIMAAQSGCVTNEIVRHMCIALREGAHHMTMAERCQFADELERLDSEVHRKNESILALLKESQQMWRIILDHGLEDQITVLDRQSKCNT